MLKWMIIFVLFQVCLGNAGVSFIKPKLINVGEVLSVLLGSEQCIWKQILLQTLPPQVYGKFFLLFLWDFLGTLRKIWGSQTFQV